MSNERLFRLGREEITLLLNADNSDENISDDEEDEIIDAEDRNFLDSHMRQNVYNQEDGIHTEVIIEGRHGSQQTGITEDVDVDLALPKNIEWKGKNDMVLPETIQKHNYDWGQIHPAFSRIMIATPYDIFSKTCNFDSLLELIVQQSTLYMHQKGKQFDTNREEISAFLGINLVMGYHVLPSLDSYWSCYEDLGVPLISKVMTRKRFRELRSSLHFNDNMSADKRDRSYKIRPLLNHFNKAFQRAMKPTEHQSIDERMCKFKGQNPMKQFMKDKPVKRGFKFWCRCDSKTGYLFEIDLYTGKKKFVEHGLGESVVLQLTDSLNGLNCEIFMDNFFSSPGLFLKLKEKDILA